MENTNLLAEGSVELINYVEQLAQKGKERNPKSLCIICWCFLTYAQKINHPIEHIKEGVKPASKYATLAGFTTFAIDHGHFQEKDEVIYFEKVKIKPSTLIQKKKSTEETRPLKDIVQSGPKIDQKKMTKKILTKF